MKDGGVMNRAVFIDKDGTLIKNVPYNIDPALITFEEGVVDGLQMLQENDFKLVVISNQSGIAHGYFTEEEFARACQSITDQLRNSRVLLEGFYYCPHHPDGANDRYRSICTCRKPQPGLLVKAAKDLDIDLSDSWMIGDILDDVEAGKRAGCKSILINNGNETKWILSPKRTPDHIAVNFFDAALFIINNSVKQLKKHEEKLG
jgi:D-glycero-D-manno-heptose 1,7-bisphosphate phosphatase